MPCSYDLNFRHLFAAVTIARLGNISRAVERIHISQPALTHAMAKLEIQLNEKLFERQNHGVCTTKAGALFLSHVEDGLNLLAEAAQQLRQNSKLKPLSTPELHITSTQLRAFLAVLRTSSYVAAAKLLNFSQPSIYRAVRELQSFLGVTLFETAGKTIRVPSATMRFGAQVQLTLSCIQSGLDELTALHDPGAGRILLGSLPLARSALLPDLLAKFSSLHPKAIINVIEGQYSELVHGLQNGTIDMLFGALRANFDPPDLIQKTLFFDELRVVCRPGHPLVTARVQAQSLLDYPWVVPAPQSPAQSIWAHFMQDHCGGIPTQQIHCGSILLARELLRKGDWLALMSPYQFELEKEYGILTGLDLKLPNSVRPIGVTLRKNWRPTSIHETFLSMAEEMAQILSAQKVD